MIRPAHWVLIMAFVVLLFNSGNRLVMGLMLPPMELDLQWTRTTLSSMVTLFLIVSAAALPFIGRFVDRLGARWVLGFGVTVSSIALALMGYIHTPLEALLLYGVLFAVGSAATSVTPIGVLLTRWFPNKVGMANSIAIAGMGVGQLLVISVLAAQLEIIGWRNSYTVLGVVSVLCVLPLIILVGRGKPSEIESPGTKAVLQAARGDVAALPTTLVQVLQFWRLRVVLVLYLLCGFQDFFIATHVVAFATDEGVGSLLAGNVLAFMGLAGLLGVLASGLLNDRYGPVLPTAISFVVRIVIFTLLLVSRDSTVIIVCALLYGSTFWITAPLAVVFARQFCGFALLGTVSGLITMVHHTAGGVGAYFGARMFDVFGSYNHAFVILLIVSVIGAALTPLLRVKNE